MNIKRVRNVLFLVLLVVGFAAAREASARGQADGCWACTGIFGETCEPCQQGEDCGRGCIKVHEGECTIFGEICWDYDET